MDFIDREDAGKRLAEALVKFKGDNTVVLALPRGGIVPAAKVAKALHAPLGLILVRKIGHPSHVEYAIGAMVEGEKPLYNEAAITDIDPAWLKRAEASARQLSKRRRELYYGDDFTPPPTAGRTVIIVDDGIATGLTMEAAVRAVKAQQPEHIVVAVPVAAPDSVARLSELADDFIVLDNPSHFLGAVGAHYHQFDQVNDEEVKTLLREARDALHKTTAKNT